MWFKIGKTIFVGYGILLTLAGGGLAFANIFGFAVGILQFRAVRAPDPAVLQSWMHRGWTFGVTAALFGVLMKRFGNSRKRKSQAKVSGEDNPQNKRQRRSDRNERRYGVLASTALGGLGGGLVGGMLGGTFILLWFSLTYSPFAPQGWGASVSVERQRTGDSGRERPVLTTDHPVAAFAFGIPLALGSITGAVFGGVAGVYEGE